VSDGESWYNLSEQLGRFGDPVGVPRTLRKAVEGGFFNYPLMLRDPLLDALRGKTEFERVVATAKVKYDAFKERYPELRDEK